MASVNIPNLKPDIKIDYTETLKLALISLSLSELSLAEVLSAEAKKLEAFVKKDPNPHEIVRINEVVSEILTSASKMEKSMNDKFNSIKQLILEYTYEQQRLKGEKVENSKIEDMRKRKYSMKDAKKLLRW